jgi:hypothetical protein
MKKLLKIDELVINDHFFLTEEDVCYYFMEYTAGRTWGYSEANNIISNLKKARKYFRTPAWKYKQDAIDEVASLINTQVIAKLDTAQITLVPIPPSKSKDDPRYDDRILTVIQKACDGVEADIRELLLNNDSMEASHESAVRPTIKELQDNLSIDETLVEGTQLTFCLFDDVLTTGAHFIACKNVLLERFPEAQVFGVFVARRAIEKEDDNDDPFILIKSD